MRCFLRIFLASCLCVVLRMLFSDVHVLCRDCVIRWGIWGGMWAVGWGWAQTGNYTRGKDLKTRLDLSFTSVSLSFPTLDLLRISEGLLFNTPPRINFRVSRDCVQIHKECCCDCDDDAKWIILVAKKRKLSHLEDQILPGLSYLHITDHPTCLCWNRNDECKEADFGNWDRVGLGFYVRL